MLNRIVRVNHPGPLASFNWPTGASTVADLRRFNLVYGWNGSGKTTISRILRALENREIPTDCEVELQVDSRRIRHSAFANETVAIRVFNSDFVSDSVLAVDSDRVAPIYVLGEESIAQQENIDQLKRQHDEVRSLLEDRLDQKTEADEALDRHRIDRAREIKESLRSPGQNGYSNYNKSDYRSRADRMLSDPDAASYRVSSTQRDDLRAQSSERLKTPIDNILYELPELSTVAETANRTLETTVVSEAIRSLRDDPDLSNWVLEGLGIHKSRSNEQCLFCDQELPGARLERLNAHFNTEYQDLRTRIADYIAKLRSEVEAIRSVALPNAAQFYEEFSHDYSELATKLEAEFDVSKRFIEYVIEALSSKAARAFDSFSLDKSPPTVDDSIIVRINELIRRHNDRTSEFGQRVRQARERLEEDAVARSLERYQELKRRADESGSDVAKLKNQLLSLTPEIARREQQMMEHLRPAEELNDELHKYLGHAEIQFTVRDSGYEITRSGVPASSLSEGEKTAIALLYFLKSLDDRAFDLSTGIVVLDDPVSSLDANALYAAFGFIRERTRHAAQLIVLTHNFAFFRQVKRWFSERNRLPQSRLLMLDVEFNNGARKSILRDLDPLLRDYESDYQYLFSRIYGHVRYGSDSDLGDNYVLPNMARRLLERFLAFRWPDEHGRGSLASQLAKTRLDGVSKARIARFVDAYSHSDAIDEAEHDPYVLGEAKRVLGELLDLVQLEDPEHYERMVKVVEKAAKGT